MKTSEGILTMPTIAIADRFTQERKYVFFPMSALLSEEEQALFELYRTAPSVDTANLEMQIMKLLEELAVVRNKNSTISESNRQFAEIEEMCRTSGVIDKLYVED